MATEFHMVAPNIFSVIIVAFVVYIWSLVNTCATLLTPSWERQMSIIVGAQDGTCFNSPFWHLQSVGGLQIFGKIVDCGESRVASYSENGETEAGEKDFHFMSSENVDRNKIKLV